MNAAAGRRRRSLSLLGPTSLLAGGPLGGLHAVAVAAEMLARRDDADALVAGAADELGRACSPITPLCTPTPAARAILPLYAADHEAPVRGEGAACFVLARAAAASTLAPTKTPIARVAGSSLAGPRGLHIAIGFALRAAEISPADVDAIYGSADGTLASSRAELDALHAVFGASLARIPLANPASILGASEGLSALTTAAAIEALRTGRAHPIAGAAPRPGLELRGASRGPVRTVLIIAADPAAGSAALLLQAP